MRYNQYWFAYLYLNKIITLSITKAQSVKNFTCKCRTIFIYLFDIFDQISSIIISDLDASINLIHIILLQKLHALLIQNAVIIK